MEGHSFKLVDSQAISTEALTMSPKRPNGSIMHLLQLPAQKEHQKQDTLPEHETPQQDTVLEQDPCEELPRKKARQEKSDSEDEKNVKLEQVDARAEEMQRRAEAREECSGDKGLQLDERYKGNMLDNEEECSGDEGLKRELAGGMDLRKPWGQKFARSSDGGKSEAYKRLKGFAAKQEFRERWARELYEASKTRKKQEVHSFKSVDETLGTYMSFARIVQEEGGDQTAIVATCNYTQACIDMGGKWLYRNPLTRRTDFLYLRHSEMQVMTQMYALYKEQEGNTESCQKGGGKKSYQSKGGQSHEGQGKFKDGKGDQSYEGQEKFKDAKVSSKKGSSGRGDKEQFPDKAKDEKKDRFVEATKLRGEFGTWLVKGRSLARKIVADEKWAWARSMSDTTTLREAVAELEALEADPFVQDWTSEKPEDIKKIYTADELHDSLGTYMKKVQKPVKLLRTTHTMLFRMHSARSAASR